MKQLKPHLLRNAGCIFKLNSQCNIVSAYFLVIMLYLNSNYLWAQVGASNLCNKIGNGAFSFNNISAINHIDPFTQNYVTGWSPIQTPQVDTLAYTSSPSSARMWSFYAIGNGPEFEGVFQQLPLLEVGKDYIFSLKVKRDGTYPVVSQVKAFMTNNAAILANNVSARHNFTLPHQPVLYINNVSNTSFQHYYVCNFKPTQQWQELVIHPEASSLNSSLQWMNVDDVELIKNFDFAGLDTIICTPGSPVTLGIPNCTDLTFGYNWYELTTNTFLSFSNQITVNPTQTTSYAVRRMIYGCDTWDTITVEVRNPPQPTLPNDTIICGLGQPFDIEATFNPAFNPSTETKWSTGYGGIGTGYNILSVLSSGTYIITIHENGCYLSDTINVTFLPNIIINPDTIRLCNYDSAIFCVTDTTYTTYLWTTQDTTPCIKVFDAGTYIVEVTDSNGCIALGYAILERYEPLNVDLGPDVIVCTNGCVNLNPIVSNSSTPGLFSYLWKGGSSSSSLCASTTGWYWVCITDSNGCYGCDSIYIRIRPVVDAQASNIDSICLYDLPVTLGHATPYGGIYTGAGVDDNIFYPRFSGPGLHTIMYEYYSDSGCLDTALFTIHVLDGPYAELTSINTCVTETSVNIPLQTQSTIPGTWSSNAPNGVFCPSCEGPGVHLVTYTIVDTITGCEYTAKALVKVGQIYNANYIQENPTGWVCEGKLVKHEATEGYRFVWVNSSGDTISQDRIAYLPANGSFILYVMDSIGNCPPTTQVITLDLAINCCEYTDPYISHPEFEEIENVNFGPINVLIPISTDMYLTNVTTYFEQSIVVPAGYTLHVIGCDIMMRNCSKILVENGGKLIMQNTQIGYCEWQGIEAGGWYDCCPGANSNNCDNGTCYTQSEIEMENVQLHHADIGVMAGFRVDYDLGCATIWKETSGGATINISHSTFSKNFIDVLFREYDNETKTEYIKDGINTCLTDGSFHNASEIKYNHFILPASAQYCNSITSELIGRVNQVGHCHIVDFADSSIFYNPVVYALGSGARGQSLRGYLGYYFGVNFLSTSSNIVLPGIFANYYSNTGCSTIKFYK
jgi:hypothetical protein